MALRDRLKAVADNNVAKFGDPIQLITITSTPGTTEFDPPVLSEVVTDAMGVVTGVQHWETSQTVLASDLKVLVGGSAPVSDLGGIIKIDGVTHTIIQVNKILAAGQASAVKYFVRRG